MSSGLVLMISSTLLILVAFSVQGIDADCSGQPCQNGGNCTLDPGAANNYTCTCVAGYTGKNCTDNIDDCADQPCKNGGNCTDAANNYTCNCAAGFSGKNCSVAPTTLPPTTEACCSISVTLKKNDDNLELQNEAFEKAIKGFFNDSDDYSKVNVSNLELTDKEDKLDMTLNLCVVQIPADGFIEDFFLTQVKNGKLLKTSIHDNSFKCKALGVEFSDWKAKDGECETCSKGGAGPIEIKGKCKPKPGYSCKGLKDTKEVDECVKYCGKSSAVSIMISTLVMAMGIALSLSYNIWE